MTDRPDVPYAADERTLLLGYLDWHRATLRLKAGGLDQAQLAQAHPPSTLTLGGLVKHLALVEDWWFGANLAGAPETPPFDTVDWDEDPDWEFRTGAEDSPEELWDLYERVVAASDAHLASVTDLDAPAARRRSDTGEAVSARWIVVHMIEEYARHNGHADLIREAVDGSTGS